MCRPIGIFNLLLKEVFYCKYFVYIFTIYPYGNFVMQPFEVRLMTVVVE